MTEPRRWANPVQVTFGAGSLARLPALLDGRECVLVTFPEARETGLEARLAQILGKQLRTVVRDVAPNPDTAWFAARHEASWRDHPDAVLVAVGGGSVIDTAKILQVASASGRFADLHEALAAGGAPDIARSRAVIAVPTTAGTGSEVTPWATLWDAGAGRKLSLHTAHTWPEHALVDPELALTLPMVVTRNAALDALSHALEAIWNRNANPVSDGLAVEAARGVIDTLPQLLTAPGDLELRSAMSRAALTAGLAFSNTATALAHSISYEMTLNHGLPHGLACSFTLPMVWRMAAGADPARDAVLARVFGASAAAPAARLEAFLRQVGVRTRFADYGVAPPEAQAMIERGLAGARGRNFVGARPARMPDAHEPALEVA
jgi:phosphonate metabolism-associated iron-containing alcohol dehydrogenase